MTATGHAVIGTIIAATIQDPIIAIPVAFGSHILADCSPHWDVGTNAKKRPHWLTTLYSVFDVLLGFFLSLVIITFLFPTTNLLYALVIILFAQGPDWLMSPYYFLKWHFEPFTFLYNLQKPFDNRMDKPWGVIIQAGILLCLIAVGVALKPQ